MVSVAQLRAATALPNALAHTKYLADRSPFIECIVSPGTVSCGDRTIHGNAIGRALRVKLMKTARDIINLGVRDPELFALVGLLEGGIGADGNSNITTHTIRPALIKFNVSVLPKLGVATEKFQYGDERVSLVRNPFESGSAKAEGVTLTVSGEKKMQTGSDQYLHRGIAGRSFKRTFQLAEYIKVEGAKLENGRLWTDLKRDVPEAMKPRIVPIGTMEMPTKAVPFSAVA